jgi:hypothetical protein
MPPKPQRLCIFCGGAPVTGEHIFPEWMHPLLAGTDNQRFEISGRLQYASRERRAAKLAISDRMRSNERTYSLQVPVVCKVCNSGWMSVLENENMSALTALIKGEDILLTPAQQLSLARWFALKDMVYDASPNLGTPTYFDLIPRHGKALNSECSPFGCRQPPAPVRRTAAREKPAVSSWHLIHGKAAERSCSIADGTRKPETKAASTGCRWRRPRVRAVWDKTPRHQGQRALTARHGFALDPSIIRSINLSTDDAGGLIFCTTIRMTTPINRNGALTTSIGLVTASFR